MSNTQKIQWKRLSVEGAAIVVSILLAFSIDAWWDNRQERIEEHRILESLKVEFLTNAENIPRYIAGHQKSAKYTLALLEAMKAADSGSTLQYPVAKFRQVLGHNSTDPQSGALDAILQSGELRFVSNAAIRERLAAWPRLVVDATENEYLLRDLWGPKLIEALAKDIDLTILSDLSDACSEDPMLEHCATLKISLPRNTVVIAYLMQTYGFAREGARELGLLVEEANNIITLINQELSKH